MNKYRPVIQHLTRGI